jgi:hypothetical protein
MCASWRNTPNCAYPAPDRLAFLLGVIPHAHYDAAGISKSAFIEIGKVGDKHLAWPISRDEESDLDLASFDFHLIGSIRQFFP